MSASASLPDQIGPYAVTAMLGAGATATVYRARPPDGRPDVAIKVLHFHLLHEPDARKRFEREARALMQLRHPHILPVYDFGDDHGAPFLVMRLLGGRTLADRIATGPLPPTEAARLTQQIGSALDYAHARGVIHRDIKPSNILLDEAGLPFLADFGVARFQASDSGEATASGDFVGTVTYASPEQCEGKPLSRASDLYALAVVVYEMLTGQPPFTGPTALAVMQQHRHAEPPNPLSANPHLPVALHAVLQKGLAKLPEGRYRSALEFSVALHAALDVHPVPLSDPDESWLHDDIVPVQPDPPDSTAKPEAPYEDDFDDTFDPDLLLPPPKLFDDDLLDKDFTNDSAETPDPTSAHARPTSSDPPIQPLPRRRAGGRMAVPRWIRLTLYGSMAVSVLATVLGLFLIIQHVTDDPVALSGPRPSLTLGISLRIPAGWDAVEAPVSAPTGDPVSGILLSEPSAEDNPAAPARMVIGVRRLDASAVFRVPPSCQTRTTAGPQATFACMARQGYVTPVYEPFAAGGPDAVLLPGTLPPTRASYPMVLLPDNGSTWLAVVIAEWHGTPHALDILQAVAASVRP